MKFLRRKVRPAYWTLVPCLPWVPPTMEFTSACPLTEGDERGEHHSHWLSQEGDEVITNHKRNEREMPNCIVRPRR